MGYVPGFEYDIFISYASVDSPCEEGKKGWVEKFVDELMKRLYPKTNRSVNFFLDKKDIVIGDTFKDTITCSLEKTATLLILISDSYLDSEWCTLEREKFMEYVTKLKGLNFRGVSGFKRIFVVKLTAVTDAKMPEELKGIHHIEFFSKDNNSTLCWPEMLLTDPRYFIFSDKLNLLSAGIGKHLKELKNCQEMPTADISTKRTLY